MSNHTLAEARRILSPLGITISYNSFDEYVVRPAGLKGKAAADAAYFTDDIDDAVGTGKLMAGKQAQ